MGSYNVLQPLPLHSTTWYFSRFLLLASLIHSFQGTASSNMIRCFEASDVIIMYGRRDVDAMCWGNLSYFPRSTCSCQSGAVQRRLVVVCGWHSVKTKITTAILSKSVTNTVIMSNRSFLTTVVYLCVSMKNSTSTKH